ncbi:MAG TPA: hypothetical protein VM238_18480 [Phycisphaerae bacterium]|nr:hypothetical protein [Phycisphaerae bacterium]
MAFWRLRAKVSSLEFELGILHKRHDALVESFIDQGSTIRSLIKTVQELCGLHGHKFQTSRKWGGYWAPLWDGSRIPDFPGQPITGRVWQEAEVLERCQRCGFERTLTGDEAVRELRRLEGKAGKGRTKGKKA